MRHKNKGFTLAELLIVVAIIGVLVAISIPIFSKQLEKARDATSVANLRAAYAEAQNEVLSPSVSRSGYTDASHHISLVFSTDGNVKQVVVFGVVIKSKKRNNWSGLGENLPFYSTLQPDPGSHGDIGKAGKLKYVVFTYNKDGNITETRLIYS